MVAAMKVRMAFHWGNLFPGFLQPCTQARPTCPSRVMAWAGEGVQRLTAGRASGRLTPPSPSPLALRCAHQSTNTIH